ncbi:aldehyde dehydrogenase [Spongiactinospora sp. 9N601]|uniref:aldehyde dehydrogenase n=1 Tax=Spongiactinospora sp. 9N601 TaxID=3375149 RepID=UPI00379B489F
MATDTPSRPKLLVGGEWVSPLGQDEIEVVSPVTEQVVGRAAAAGAADMDRAVRAARKAFDDGVWRDSTPAERGAILARAADILAERADEISELITLENGSPVVLGGPLQVGPVLDCLRYYAELASTFDFERELTDEAGSTLATLEPAGVVVAVTPWNAPLLVAIAKIAPAIVAGCAVVLKPAPETPLSSYFLAEALYAAGLPHGLLSVVPAGREAGEQLVAHPGVDKVSFTGSTAAGRRVMAIAADRIARVTLELGGKSAAVILDDADVDTVVAPMVTGAMMLSGQICIAQTRILAPRSRYDEIVRAVSDAARAQVVGAPSEPATWVGPLVAERQRERVEGYIRSGLEEGAKIATGGGRPPHLPSGWYIEPTVFYDVRNSMRIAREEIFGPVLAVIPYDDDDDAAYLANDSDFGLYGGVWTADEHRGLAFARRIRAGTVNINASTPARGTAAGGFKQSGIGRELGREGLKEYLELRSIVKPRR